jgi:hypothetical protein
LLISPWGLGAAPLDAEELGRGPATTPAIAAASSAETPTHPTEAQSRPGDKSVVVKSGKASEAASTQGEISAAEPASDGAEQPLAPISKTSEREPDLADPALGDPTVEPPTLADDYVAFASDGAGPPMPTAEAPTASDPAAGDLSYDANVHEGDASAAPVLVEMQAATFNGVTPGATTRAGVLRAWGQPVAKAGSGSSLIYELKNFPSVTVGLHGDVVESVHIELAAPADAAILVEKLGLSSLQPAVLTDDGGDVSTTFPERGVTLGHRPAAAAAVATDALDKQASGRVYEIVMRPIEAPPFLLRAETSAPRDYASRIADLETALRLDPKNAHARWLLSLTRLATGAAVQAEALVSEAVDLEPRNHAYRLQWARCLKYLARYDQAVEQTRLVLESTDVTPILRAQALEQMALLAELGSLEVQKQAIALHNKAIDQADPLTTDDDRGVRQAATQVLVNAHLAVAERIAAGDSLNKDELVAQWISRASALGEQMIADGEADVSLRLQVAVSALASGGRLSPPIDPQLWVSEAEQAAKALKTDANDDLADAEIQWQLGLAYCYATEISHKRAEADDALRYGVLADAALTSAARSRQELPDTLFVLGRLYFQVGAVYAVHRSDHATACQWYDRAIEPLSSPAPVTALASPGLHSDALVSMAVSYWQNGDRDRAYELTGAGVELAEQGIAEGLLPANALEVPRNNFLAMSRALGKVPLATPPADERDGVQTAQDVETPVKRATRSGSGRSQTRTATRRNSASNDVRRR